MSAPRSSSSNNSYTVDRSQALADLQANYGMTGGMNGYRLPTLEKTSKTAEADLTPSSSSDDGSSFSTSSTATSTTSKASLKEKAVAFLRFSSSSNKGNKRQAAAASAALIGLENNESMATLISSTSSSSSASQKPDPSLVFAHMSSTYGVAGHGFAGYKIPNLEKQDRKAAASNKKGARVPPARDTPEAVLAELMNSYGAPARSPLLSHT